MSGARDRGRRSGLRDHDGLWDAELLPRWHHWPHGRSPWLKRTCTGAALVLVVRGRRVLLAAPALSQSREWDAVPPDTRSLVTGMPGLRSAAGAVARHGMG